MRFSHRYSVLARSRPDSSSYVRRLKRVVPLLPCPLFFAIQHAACTSLRRSDFGVIIYRIGKLKRAFTLLQFARRVAFPKR